MPVLARVIESLGIPTVTVTMMPDLAQKMRASRIVGVEFPFGHSFGLPHRDDMMRAVSLAACQALEEAGEPGYRLDVDIEWPIATEVAYKQWQPKEPSPIVAASILRARQAQQAQQAGS